jgi:formylglycine-generating enzyme required for sulfatase activity
MRSILCFAITVVLGLILGCDKAPAPAHSPTPAPSSQIGEIVTEYKCEEITINLPGLPADATPLIMVRIPDGNFMMGSSKSSSSYEKPVHRVSISKDFWLGKYEVTQAQWQTVMGSNPSDFKGSGGLPVEQVSWNDCHEFIKKLNTIVPGKGVRLPSEAEWEYACRAGSQTEYCYGDSVSELDSYAWYYDIDNTTSTNNTNSTHEVGGKRPNAWGLYDMHGNVFEWCEDRIELDYTNSARRDPKGPRKVSNSYLRDHRRYRGGCYCYSADSCRSASRNGTKQDTRARFIGLRIVGTP